MLEGQLDDSQVIAMLRRVRAAAGTLAEPMRSIGRLLKTSTQFRFRDQEDPQGIRWKPSKRVVDMAFRFNFGGQTLSLTRRLRNSITYVADASSVAVGTNVLYGPTHQFGRSGTDVISAHSRRITRVFGELRGSLGVVNVRMHSRRVDIPARPFLGFSEADRRGIMAILEGHLSRASGGAAGPA
jgi:phage gpG-like protein